MAISSRRNGHFNAAMSISSRRKGHCVLSMAISYRPTCHSNDEVSIWSIRSGHHVLSVAISSRPNAHHVIEAGSWPRRNGRGRRRAGGEPRGGRDAAHPRSLPARAHGRGARPRGRRRRVPPAPSSKSVRARAPPSRSAALRVIHCSSDAARGGGAADECGWSRRRAGAASASPAGPCTAGCAGKVASGKDADGAALKKNYRRLSIIVHPDKAQGVEAVSYTHLTLPTTPYV